MSEIPEEAVSAATEAASAPLRQAVFREEIRKMLVAAAPHLLAAEVSAHRAEQDAVHADLSQLLRVLGMGDHARPQSSHQVMLDAINEVGRIRVALERAEAIIGERDRQLAAARAERERLSHREAVLASVKAELDDAFQFSGKDGVRHSYVTREWVQVLLAEYAASAAAAEREAIITLASALRATIPADHPVGAQASFADYLRLTSADRLEETHG